jgi:hypothetical protein
MKRFSRHIVLAGVTLASSALAAAVSSLGAQQDLGRNGTSWSWNGPATSGGTLSVYNLNGAMRFTASPDGDVHVNAEKRVHSGGDPATVHYAVVHDGDNLVICALWRDDATCDADGAHYRHGGDRGGDRRRNVTAEMSVQVPTGVRLSANTVNGDVSAEGIRSAVRAETVNGAVRVTASGDVAASTVNGDVTLDTRSGTARGQTVNGSIIATIGADGTSNMNFQTVNGSITINAPSSFSADVRLSTIGGSIESKFPLNFDRFRRRADGTVGRGGRRLSASTVNGSITLN